MKEQLLHYLRRVPSPHNTQPLQWEIGENEITCFYVRDRILDVSDKNLRDLKITIGIAHYILEMITPQFGISIKETEFNKFEHIDTISQTNNSWAFKALLSKQEKTQVDELECIEHITCYRGVFSKSHTHYTNDENNIKILNSQDELKKIAQLYDEAIVYFMSNADYAQELNKWLRLSKSHPNYFEDGLNARSLRLNPILAMISTLIMRPSVLSFFSKIGLLKMLISESSQNSSAEGILIVTRKANESDYEVGKRIYQIWMELYHANKVFCPITSLIDDEVFMNKTKSIFKTNEEIFHILRFGEKPIKEKLDLTPRLSNKKITKA